MRLYLNEFVYVCVSAGVHLPAVLEEQGHPTENQDGRHQESFPLPFREQHPETTQTVC